MRAGMRQWLCEQYGLALHSVREALVCVLGKEEYTEIARRHSNPPPKPSEKAPSRYRYAYVTSDAGFNLAALRERSAVLDADDPMFAVRASLSARVRIW